MTDDLKQSDPYGMSREHVDGQLCISGACHICWPTCIHDNYKTECIECRDSEITRLQSQVEALTLVGRDTLPCGLCGLPVMFEFTVPSDIWNRIVRRRGISEYLCVWCFNKLAEEDGETRIQIGVNFVESVVHSGWCDDDVPGTYPNEPTKAELLKEVEALTRERDECLPWTPKLLRQYVTDTSEGFKCLPGCNSEFHDEECPVTNVVAAFRILREKVAQLEEQLRNIGQIAEMGMMRGAAFTLGQIQRQAEDALK